MSIRTPKFLAVVVTVFLSVSVALADENAPAATTPANEATAPAATETNDDAGVVPALPSRLQIHGYLTQAYARADQHQIIGIPTDGTAEYRAAALQFRYAIAKNDSFVLQIAHERMGASWIEQSEVDLDWGFYERRFGASTSLRVGRVQIPFGIYNEIRDVGTLLPFYRIAFNYYGEEAYTSETCDGLSLTHRFRADSPWSLEVSGYAGGWDSLQTRETVAKAKIENAIGTQLWLSTPVDGLRLGAGGYRATESEGFLPRGVELRNKALHASVDGNFERVLTRAEVRRSDVGGMTETSYYAQLGYRFTPRLMVVAQTDVTHVKVPAHPPFAPAVDTTVGRDVAAAVNYFVRPDLVLKVEGHRNRHVAIEDGIPILGLAPRADYAIVSLSVSF